MVAISSKTPSHRKPRLRFSYVIISAVFITLTFVVALWNVQHEEAYLSETMKHSVDTAIQIEGTLPPGTKTKLGLSRDPTDPPPPYRSAEPFRLRKFQLHNRLMVIPEYKLLFCYIEKVGCSMFNQLFRLLRIYHPSISDEERAYLADSHFGKAKGDHFNMTIDEVSKLMVDKEWTKAVFFRDPADRFLSGFKSMCGGIDWDGGRNCRTTFGMYVNDKGNERPILGGDVSSFHQAIDIATNASWKVYRNPHFKPAADFCGGLRQTINHYDFVHQLDKKTVGTHIKTLFDHIGVDPKMTEGLLERVVNTGGGLQKSDIDFFQKNHGLNLKGSIASDHHTKDHYVAEKEYFGSPGYLQKLQKVYDQDYDMFELVPPTYDEL